MIRHADRSELPLDIEGFHASMRAAGIEEVADSILSTYLQESRALISALVESYASGDAEALRRAAHTLKGSSGSVQAAELSEILASIESTVMSGNLEAVGSLVERARDAHSSVVVHLTEHGYE